jgi:exodeoxyribonuclease-1
MIRLSAIGHRSRCKRFQCAFAASGVTPGCEIALGAVDLSRDRFEEPEYPEQQLYSGGCISNRDMTALDRFHQVAPEHKLDVARTLGDARLRYLAERLIYEEWPKVLPLEIRVRLDAELRQRHFAQTECRWTTVSAAIETTEELLLSTDDGGRAVLAAYREYLLNQLQPEANCSAPS